MGATNGNTGGERLGFIDDARGLAVVLMIFWHTVDGWIRKDLGATHPELQAVMVLFGGTAAPMFVSLAGVSAAMKLDGDRARGKPASGTVRALVARGLYVVASGYALRVYMWCVDDRALLRLSAAPATIPAVLGLLALTIGLERVGEGRPRGAWLSGVGLAAYVVGVIAANLVGERMAPNLLKVDVLQAIGMSIVIVALVDPLLRTSSRPWLAVIVALLIAIPTDRIATLLPGPLPAPLAAWFGRWEGTNQRSLAGFPLFPWLGYAFLGAAIGKYWFRASDSSRADAVVFGVSSVAAGIAALANSPIVHGSVFPNAPLLYKAFFMVHKVGFGLSLVALVHLFTRVTGFAPLREFGKTSMVVYWVHLEFAYGVCARPLKHRLDYVQWAVGFVILTLAMAGVAKARLRLPEWYEAAKRARNPEGAGSS